MPGIGVCIRCGAEFPQTRSPSTARKTCSTDCYKAVNSARMAATWRDGRMRKPDRKGKAKGSANPRWKGGSQITDSGYRLVWMPEHPHARRGRVREHRLVMEQHIGRILDPREVVHHRNGDKQDNRIENLELIPSNAEHGRHHVAEGTSAIERARIEHCADCGDNFRTMDTSFGAQRFCLRCRRRARNR